MPRRAINWSGVKVDGLEEAREMFNDAKKAFSPAAIQDAILPAARIIRDDAKRRVRLGAGHYMSGPKSPSLGARIAVGLGLTQATKDRYTAEYLHLRDAIFATKGKRGASDVIAGVDLKKAPHAHLVEFGTKPHMIRPRPPKKFLVIFGRLIAFVQHPGIPKKKYAYLRPAVSSTRPRVLKSITDGLVNLLLKKMRPVYGPGSATMPGESL